ncbi:MAG: hypothetical protein H7Z71_01435 [Moraxellaceae bacterium]|nr:hypothetical protein [Pseudobdellovibrionaceae bacterium]
MSYSLSLEDRKQQFEAENIKFGKTVPAFTVLELEKELGYKTKKLALFEDKLSPLDVIGLAHRKSIDYVIQNSLQSFSEKVKVLGAIDRNPQSYYKEDFTFFAKPVGKHKIIFDSKTPRKTIVNLCFHRLQINIDTNRSHNLKTVLEELIMNAQIDAPSLGNGKGFLKSTLILEKVDKLIAVSIIDLYGTLTYSKFIGQIESVLNLGVSVAMNQNRQRGAGIGSSIIYNAAESLYLGCLPNEKTRVTAIVPFGLSEANQEKLQKSIFLL